VRIYFLCEFFKEDIDLQVGKIVLFFRVTSWGV
jgi:hypothetical protein